MSETRLDRSALVGELRRRANFPSNVPDKAWLIGIRYLLRQDADALESCPWCGTPTHLVQHDESCDRAGLIAAQKSLRRANRLAEELAEDWAHDVSQCTESEPSRDDFERGWWAGLERTAAVTPSQKRETFLARLCECGHAAQNHCDGFGICYLGGDGCREFRQAALTPVAGDVREALAKAWDEGAVAAWERSTPEVNGSGYHWRSSGEPANPYRVTSKGTPE